MEKKTVEIPQSSCVDYFNGILEEKEAPSVLSAEDSEEMEKRHMMQEIRNLYNSNLTCPNETEKSWEYKL